MALSIASGEPRRCASEPTGQSRSLQLVLRLEAWLDRRKSRRALYGMTDYALKDIGLTEADLGSVDWEASWQALLEPTRLC